MHRFVRVSIGIVLCTAFCLRGETARASATPASAASTWLQGWPMVGHDPQRTNSSPDIGPLHPHLLFAHPDFYAQIVGPDGSLYGSPTHATSIIALDASGHQRWDVGGCCEEGYLALAPDGTLFDMGGVTVAAGDAGNGTVAIGVAPDGTVTWKIDPFGLAKGAVSLVSPDGKYYAPVIGPHNETGSEPYIGLDVVSPEGKVLQHIAQSVSEPALAPSGTLYDGDPLRAIAANGSVLWIRNVGATVGPLIGEDGTLYLGARTTLYAYTSTGGKRWKRNMRDGVLALAERADGDLLVAGSTHLHAFSPDGTRLWSVRIGKTTGSYNRPSLVVDAAGTAYVGTMDGKLRIISDSGTLISTLHVGPASRDQFAPAASPLLAPGGRLVVNGTDGVLRVYGS
jgi:hypothetical protein